MIKIIHPLKKEKKPVNRYQRIAGNKLERTAARQRALKQILLNIRNGAMITPAIWAIEQLYNPENL